PPIAPTALSQPLLRLIFQRLRPSGERCRPPAVQGTSGPDGLREGVLTSNYSPSLVHAHTSTSSNSRNPRHRPRYSIHGDGRGAGEATAAVRRSPTAKRESAA